MGWQARVRATRAYRRPSGQRRRPSARSTSQVARSATSDPFIVRAFPWCCGSGRFTEDAGICLGLQAACGLIELASLRPGPAAPLATPPASRCASWDGAPSSWTASSSGSRSSSSRWSPPALPACLPSTGSALTLRRCCSSPPETIPGGCAARRPGRTCVPPPPSRRRQGKSPATGSTRRRPPGQPRLVADRVHPAGIGPGYPRLRRTPPQRRKVQGRDYPLPVLRGTPGASARVLHILPAQRLMGRR